MNVVDSGGLDVSSKTQKEESYPGPADSLKEFVLPVKE